MTRPPVQPTLQPRNQLLSEQSDRRQRCERFNLRGEGIVETNEAFHDLLRRVRGGEPEAAAELLRLYEPEVRRAVHMRLTDPSLRRLLDSMDVCQSVFAAFYVRAAAGEFDLDRPDELLRLLVRMAANRLNDHYRRHRAARRDQRRQLAGDDEALQALAAADPTPSQVVANRDLLGQVLARLPAAERYLAEQRGLGRGWDELAAELGQSPDALRMRLKRCLGEASQALGLEGQDDE